MSSKARSLWVAVLACIGIAFVAQGQVVPRTTAVRERSFRSPALYVPEQAETLQQIGSERADRLRPALSAFGVTEDSIFFDSRTNRVSSLVLHQPLLPGKGTGNSLSWAGAAPSGDAALQAAAWNALKGFLTAHQADLRIDMSELSNSPRIGVYDKGTLIFIHVPRVVDGIPVRDNSIGAAIKHGNLVLLGIQKWGDVDVARAPAVSADAARAAVVAFAQPLAVTREVRGLHLELIPMANGESIEYRLAWSQVVKVGEDIGTWEGLVDAANGTLFAFQDRNQYADGQVTGGIYPLSNDQRLPDGVEQAGQPMSFVDYTVDGVKNFTDLGGNTSCIPGSVSTSLAGIFLKMQDNCGAINESGTGGVDLGFGPTPEATDCVVPPGHSAGDTKASRTGYYELNRQMEKARSHLGPTDPAGIWLRQQLTSNMNINDTCNAFWDGSSVNFFKSGGGCRNTGEQAAIFDHEWGHGIDDNGINPSIASPGEAIADMYAMLRLNTSCIGRGFFINQTCTGYGDSCNGTPADGCTGVRDIDYVNHECNLPHTITWAQGGFDSCPEGGGGCGSGGGGPCGGEVHCEGMVMAEAGWDLMTRDLTAPPYNYSSQRAHELASRLIYIGSQPVSSWYTCSVGGSCNATGGYLSILAVDDDNGNLNDGTPHMKAIRAAFERHEIHCSTLPVSDSGCVGAPAQAPAVTLEPRDRAIVVSWNAVPNAASYLVYRGDGIDGCNFGRPIIADTSELSFLDEGLANGRLYSYSVVPVGANEACFGPMSTCVQGEPVPGPNLAVEDVTSVSGGDGDLFLDNCELDTITFSVRNIGGGDLSNLRIVAISAIDQPDTQIVTALPAPIAATAASCAAAEASFQVIPAGLTYNGSASFLVEVTADDLPGGTRSKVLTLHQTESDFIGVASQTFDFEADNQGWAAISGTFSRVVGSGAQGTNAHLSSSSGIANECDIARSPAVILTANSTLSMFLRFSIEPTTGGEPFDRANVSLVNAVTGERTVVSPNTGRVYGVPDGAPNGSCQTSGQAGWNGTNPTYPNWTQSAWDSASVTAGGALVGVPAYLQVNYGTDDLVSGSGIDIDQIRVTNFQIQVPDAHQDDCSNATLVAPSALAVDADGNGVLEAGETAVVSPTWHNTGVNAVTLIGSASAFDGPAGPTYDLTDAAGAYAALDPTDSGACADCYGVSITAAARPLTHWDATVTENVNAATLAEGSLAQKVWTLHVGGSFSDVASSSNFYPSIETVLHNGVTAGCGAGTAFCPTDVVTRQQMAVFLLKAAEGGDYTPPPCVTPAFDDVPCSSPFAAWINELAVRKVTAGCGGGSSFCPLDPTTRQQMAVFLLKTKEGFGYTPPACVTPAFDDVPCSSSFAPWINELVAREVTAGCGGTTYCPGNQVSRQQMAVFLVKTFGLVLYGP